MPVLLIRTIPSGSTRETLTFLYSIGACLLVRSCSCEHIPADWQHNVNFVMTIIEIRPFRNGWKCFEAPCIEPVFLEPLATTQMAANIPFVSILWTTVGLTVKVTSG